MPARARPRGRCTATTAPACNQCERHVYNFASLTRAEAEELIEEKEGRLCVRLYRRADGTVLTADCPVGVETLRRRAARKVMMIVGAVLGLIGGGFVTRALVGEDRGSATLRRLQPFKALFDAIDPNPPICVMGAPPPPPGWRNTIVEEAPPPHEPEQ